MVNNSKAFKVARYAIMFATIFVAMMLDRAISLVPLGFSMAACALLVTLSFCFLDNTWLSALMAGLMFGLASFAKEFVLPSPTMAVFPPQYWLLITIPPRVAMVAVAFGAYRLMLLATKGVKNARKRQLVCLAVASFCGLVTNTFGFLGALELCRAWYGVQTNGVFVLIYGLLVTNILPEYAISVLCVPFVVVGVRRGLKLGLEGNNGKKMA